MTSYFTKLGLDPAGPGFHSAPDELSLDSQDADFVDVIHTNGGINFRAGELGIREGIGDADFYPNGGRQQPACAFYLVSPWRSDEIRKSHLLRLELCFTVKNYRKQNYKIFFKLISCM